MGVESENYHTTEKSESLIKKIPEKMATLLTDASKMASRFQIEIEQELKIIEGISPKVREDKEMLADLTQRLEEVETVANYLGIQPPPEQFDEGASYDEFTYAWAKLRDGRSQVARTFEDLDRRASQKTILEAMKVILEHQGLQINQMIETLRRNPDELIAVAQTIRIDTGLEEVDEPHALVKADILKILQDSPIVKIHLKNKLLERGHRPEFIDTAFWKILKESGEIEMGWCTNAARVASGESGSHGAGVLFKLSIHEIPEGIAFYKGRTRKEVVEKLQTQITEIVSGLNTPLVAKEILELYRKKYSYLMSKQRISDILHQLSSKHIISLEWNRRKRTRLYGPKKEEVNS